MAPIAMEHHGSPQMWALLDQHRGRGDYGHHWPPGAHIEVGSSGMARESTSPSSQGLVPPGAYPGLPGRANRRPPATGREFVYEGGHMGKGYTIKRCQGFVRCDMDIDAEVVGWVIGKNGSTIKDFKHKTRCNMWVDQRALKLTITGPEVTVVEHAAKSVEAYIAAAPIKAGAVEAAVTRTLACPPRLLDLLGDRVTIARVVKETHAQVVVNKKIGNIIVRGDAHAVELACTKVQATIFHALHAPQPPQPPTPPGLPAGFFVGGGPPQPLPPPPGLTAAAHQRQHPYLHDLGTPNGEGHSGPGPSAVLPPFQHGGGGDSGGGFKLMEPPPYRVFRGRGEEGSETDSEVEVESLISSHQTPIGTPVHSAPTSPRALQQHGISPRSTGTGGGGSGGGGGHDFSLFSGLNLGVSAPAWQEVVGTSPVLGPAAPPAAAAEDGERGDGGGGAGCGVGAGAGPAGTTVTDTFALGAAALSTVDEDPAEAEEEERHEGLGWERGRAQAQGQGRAQEGKREVVGQRAPPSGVFGSDRAAAKSSSLSPRAASPVPVRGEEEGGAAAGGAGAESGDTAASGGGGGAAVDKDEAVTVEEGEAAGGGAGEEQEGEEKKMNGLAQMLGGLGLGKYVSKFAEAEVDMVALTLMAEQDLADIGIPKGPRLKILNARGR